MHDTVCEEERRVTVKSFTEPYGQAKLTLNVMRLPQDAAKLPGNAEPVEMSTKALAFRPASLLTYAGQEGMTLHLITLSKEPQTLEEAKELFLRVARSEVPGSFVMMEANALKTLREVYGASPEKTIKASAASVAAAVAELSAEQQLEVLTAVAGKASPEAWLALADFARDAAAAANAGVNGDNGNSN